MCNLRRLATVLFIGLMSVSCREARPITPIEDKPTISGDQRGITKICLAGWIYYEQRIHMDRGGLAIAIGPDTRPIPCGKAVGTTAADKNKIRELHCYRCALGKYVNHRKCRKEFGFYKLSRDALEMDRIKEFDEVNAVCANHGRDHTVDWKHNGIEKGNK